MVLDKETHVLLKRSLYMGLAICGAQIVRAIAETDKPMNFLRYAITLEAQQVPLYARLSAEAEHQRQAHIAAGLTKAKVVEQQHHVVLKQEARRLGVAAWPWSMVGAGLGYFSGAVLSKLPMSTALKTIIAIETKAAGDYREAGSRITDRNLARIYLDHQVDEESHYSWAREMLNQYF